MCTYGNWPLVGHLSFSVGLADIWTVKSISVSLCFDLFFFSFKFIRLVHLLDSCCINHDMCFWLIPFFLILDILTISEYYFCFEARSLEFFFIWHDICCILLAFLHPTSVKFGYVVCNFWEPKKAEKNFQMQLEKEISLYVLCISVFSFLLFLILMEHLSLSQKSCFLAVGGTLNPLLLKSGTSFDVLAWSWKP